MPPCDVPWSVSQSDELYQVSRWGQGHFSIDEQGRLCACPQNAPPIALEDVIAELKEKGLELPAVIRFHDILRERVSRLNQTFRSIISEASYPGEYFGVYPIKVNQMREVVEEVLEQGKDFQYGIEAGSKAEVLAALALHQNPQALTVFNGYKDKDFIRLALLGELIGLHTVIIIERFEELGMVAECARELNIRPRLGLRSKLSGQGSGAWAKSSGDEAKFGLCPADLLEAIWFLQEADLISGLELFHFHIGSQVNDIQAIKRAVSEGARTFCELSRLGAPLTIFNAGGGLAVDYDGSNSTFRFSRNYDLRDYASDIIYTLKEACQREGLAPPHIVTESGRAVAAHHSCVVLDVFGEISAQGKPFPFPEGEEAHFLVEEMRDVSKELEEQSLLGSYNEAKRIRHDALSAYSLGVLSLEERAAIESQYWAICQQVLDLAEDGPYLPEDIVDLKDKLVSRYLCNFSVFQSAPDSWAIGQLLPIAPLSRLDERPSVQTQLADITCDSDGKIDRFIDFDDVKNTLALHPLRPGEDYHLGIFLTGAYQDIMGDTHNLFGRLNEVHVFSDPSDPRGFYLEEEVRGEQTQDVLRTLQYNPENMARSIKKRIDQQIKEGKVKPREGTRLIDYYEACLNQYTYLS